MSNNIGLGEITRGTEPRLKIAEEREVEVELLVVSAIEGATGGLPHTASRAHLSVIEDQRRGAVLAVGLLENLAPDSLGAAEYFGDELAPSHPPAHLWVLRAFRAPGRPARLHSLTHSDRSRESSRMRAITIPPTPSPPPTNPIPRRSSTLPLDCWSPRRIDGRGPYPLARRFNVAPTTTVPLMIQAEDGTLTLYGARWGLVPFWWKQPEPPALTFNARSEEAAAKPMWRHAYRNTRCLMPAEGWYEWQ